MLHIALLNVKLTQRNFYRIFMCTTVNGCVHYWCNTCTYALIVVKSFTTHATLLHEICTTLIWVSEVYIDLDLSQICMGDSIPPLPAHVMASPAGAQIGVFSQQHTQKQTQNKYAHNLRTLCSILNMFIFTLRPR